MNTGAIRALKPNVTQEEAVRFFLSRTILSSP